jgi:DNA repair photolyase
MVLIKEVTCRSALQKSGLADIVYALNPYRGCENSCIYCYGPSVLREDREWGKFVDVKRNIPSVLARELRRFEKGLVQVGTVTDAYQPVEKRLEITRLCLRQLARHDWPVTVQTKSVLVERDTDLLKKFSEVDVGMTITSMDDRVRRLYEPRVSSFDEQIRVLGTFSSSGIDTWVYIAPIIPFVTDRDPEKMARRLAGAGISTVFIDRLRPKGKAWERVERFILGWKPGMREQLTKIRENDEEYFQGTARALEEALTGLGIKVESYVNKRFSSV